MGGIGTERRPTGRPWEQGQEKGHGEAMGVAPRDGISMRGAGEMGGMVDGTPVGPPDVWAMTIMDDAGAVTSDVGDAGYVDPCEGCRGGRHWGHGWAR